jgi:hypothetical protein
MNSQGLIGFLIREQDKLARWYRFLRSINPNSNLAYR